MALLMAGCNKFETVVAPEEEPTVESPRHLTVDISVNKDFGTRALKQSWEAGDVVYVFFDHFFVDYLSDPDIATTGFVSGENVLYMTLTYNGYYWESAIHGEALESYLLNQATGSLAAFYCSKVNPTFRVIHGNRTREQFLVDVSGCWGGFYLLAENCEYTVSNGKLNATLEMYPHERDVVFVLPGVAKGDFHSQYYLKSDQFMENRISEISSDNVNNQGFGAPYFTIISGNSTLYPTYDQDGATFIGRIKNYTYVGQEKEYVIQIVDQRRDNGSNNKDDIVYTLTKTATLNGREVIKLPPLTDPSWVKSHANNPDTRGFLNGHEWVEMADGRKWATMNYNAKDETGYGSLSSWSGAVSIAQSWGAGWRLPTFQEWMDLLYNHSGQTTFNKVYKDGVFIGVDVVRWNNQATYRVDEMFLPAGGCYDGSFHLIDNANGYYWTSLATDASNTTANAVKLLSDASEETYPFTMVQLPANYIFAIRPIVDE